MQYVADLHLHSKYSRAVSQQMVLPEMARWAVKKGINLLTVSDWTHPLWFREIKAQLEEAREGLYKLKSETRNPKFETNSNYQNSNVQKQPLFLLSTEIASIYKQGEKLRRIHNLVFAPNFETAEKINKELTKRGCNLHSDGRPIIGISSKSLLELALSIDERTMLIPCHVWTPHFGIYGSASGFDSLEEAFQDLAQYVYGIETGLSSDPEMNWQMKELVNRSILSFSDAHSPAKMGREATVFELEEPSYENIRNAIMRKTDNRTQNTDGRKTEETDKTENQSSVIRHSRILYTIEFYPEEGKYHFSGHRNCKVVFGPQDIKTKGNICPICKRRLTEGVLYRLNQLSKESLFDRVEQKYNNSRLKWYTDKMKIHPPFVKLVPLNEIIAESMEATVLSEKVKIKFDKMCSEFGSEIEILLKTPLLEISSKFGAKIAEGVAKVREGDIFIDPGYDGEYGKVKIWEEEKPTTGVSNVNQEAQLGLKF